MYPGTWAATTPDKTAVISATTGRSITFKTLDDRSATLAAAIHGLGLRKGDVIALLSDNNPQAYEFLWAAFRSGLYVAPINRHLAPQEVAYIINDSDAKVLVVSAGLRALAEQLVPLMPLVEHRYVFDGEALGYNDVEDLLGQAGPHLQDQPRGSEMPYSSGTTGTPKGIRPTLPAIQIDEPGDPMTGILANAFHVGSSDVYYSPAPVYHVAPLKWGMSALGLGATVVMTDKFDAEEFLATIEKYQVTVVQVVPTMFVRLLQLPEEIRKKYDLSSLKLVVHVAAPCPPDVKKAMIDWLGPKIVEYYSASEQLGMTMITSSEWLQRPGSVGKHGLGVAHVVDSDGIELPPGGIGLVYFEREMIPFEYYKDPKKTLASQLPGNPTWTTVGDIGYLDEDGYLFLTDRQAFTIISGGINIYPQEVENVLTMHPKIFDVAVIGVPDSEYGQSVKAVIQLKDGIEGAPELEREFIDYVRERIAHFKAPKSVDFVKELPRTPTGKLVKRILERQYIESAR